MTPFLSMVRSLDGRAAAIDLYYCTEEADDAVLLGELRAAAARHAGVRITHVAAARDGLLTAAAVRASSGDLTRAHVFLCGPEPMVAAMPAQFPDLGLPDDHVHAEDFRLRGRMGAPVAAR